MHEKPLPRGTRRAIERLTKTPPRHCHFCCKEFKSQEHTFIGEDASGAVVVACMADEKKLKRIYGGGVFCKAGEKPSQEAIDTHPAHSYNEVQKTVDRFVELAEQEQQESKRGQN